MLKSDLYLLAKQHTCSSSDILLLSTAVVFISLLAHSKCQTLDVQGC